MSSLRTIRTCYFLLPGHELDGFPRHLDAENAQRLLSGWIALWDPRLIAVCGAAPYWHPAEHPPTAAEDCIVVIPPLSESSVPTSWLQENESPESRVLLFRPPNAPWQQCQDALLELITQRLACAPGDVGGVGEVTPASGAEPVGKSPDGEEAEAEQPQPDPLALPVPVDQVDWTTPLEFNDRETFAALGYAFLQIELMTRQMRYTSNLDRALFDEQVTRAARATLRGDTESATQMVQSCFDSLGQERDHYYSLDVHLVDVTLLAPTTLNNSLRRQLADPTPTTVLASADLFDILASTAPDNLETLRQRAKNASMAICGGLLRERPHPLMTADALRRDLARGREAYQRHDLPVPEIFGRFTYGMTPDDVAEIARAGFRGVVLIAWSEGEYPTGSQSKILWESSDGTYLSTLSCEPLDAADPASYLALGWRIGELLDHEHVPTLCLAHWPGRASSLHALLHRIAKHTPALGIWRTLQEYFNETDEPYHQERLSPHSFRFDWVTQSNRPQDLICRVKAYHQLHVRLRSLQNLTNLVSLLERRPAKPAEPEPSPAADSAEPSPPRPDPNWGRELTELWALADSLFDSEENLDQTVEELNQRIAQEGQQVLRRLAKHLLPTGQTSSPVADACGGELLLNPRSCPLRIRTRTAPDEAFLPESWRHSTGLIGQHRYTNIDVPGLGFVIAPLTTGQHKAGTPDRGPVLGDESGTLRNEFLEAQIDPQRGHLRSLYVPHRRGNHLSVMVGRRIVQDKGQIVHSEMIAERVELRTSSPMAGLIRSTGSLRLNGEKCGEFEIDYEVWRGSRVLEVTIRLSTSHLDATANPWRDAIVLRLAWPTEAAILRTFQCGWRHSWPHGKAVSPLLVEIDEAEYRTYYLCGGLAFHRREDLRMLETLLAVENGQCEHRVGFAVDLPQPLQAACDFVDRRYSMPLPPDQAAEPQAAWLVAADMRNVIVDLEAPLVDEQGRARGIRVLLTETQGKSTAAKVRLPHAVAAAARVNALGKVINRLTTIDDGFAIPLRANERCLVDVYWRGDSD